MAAAIRREREKVLGATSIRGLWPQALRDMSALGLGPEEILAVLSDVDVQPVLTAHPTEAKRASVRERHRALYEELVRNEYPKYTDRERRRIRERIVTALETLWRTGEIHLVRPDIYRELRDAIHYLRDLFPSALNRLDLHFTEAWRDAGFPQEMLRAAGNIPRLSFGTWIGGDRDGHPLVTPEVTAKALEMLRRASFQLLKRVGLAEQSFYKYPHEFSGGQRQRIAIARCLTMKPDVLICDESVSALDVSVQAQVLNLLQDLQDEFGMSYIFISHDLAVVKYISDEIMVMNDGQIVEMADSDEIYRSPKQEYTRKLLSSIPKGLEKAAELA